MTLKRKLILICFLLSVIWLIVLLFSLSSGTFELTIFKDFNSLSEIDRKVLFGIRLPRILMASIAGGTLAVCGAALQAMFRNLERPARERPIPTCRVRPSFLVPAFSQPRSDKNYKVRLVDH